MAVNNLNEDEQERISSRLADYIKRESVRLKNRTPEQRRAEEGRPGILISQEEVESERQKPDKHRWEKWAKWMK